MEAKYTYFSAEDGLNIGDSLSDQLGCFTVVATAIAVTTILIGGIVSSLAHLFY